MWLLVVVCFTIVRVDTLLSGIVTNVCETVSFDSVSDEVNNGFFMVFPIGFSMVFSMVFFYGFFYGISNRVFYGFFYRYFYRFRFR